MSVHTFGPQELFLHRNWRNSISNSSLARTKWNMYDALTGNYICSIVNGTHRVGLSDGAMTDPNGNMLMYYDNATAGTQIIYPNNAAALLSGER